MILDPSGHRAPPSEIVARLQQVHPALGMKYMPMANAFMLTYEWPENDPRRAMIQAGEVSPDQAFDPWGYAPAGVSVEDAYHILVASLKRHAQTKQSAQDMLDRVYAFNKQQEAANAQPALDYADEMIEYNAPHLMESLTGKSTIRHYVNGGKKR